MRYVNLGTVSAQRSQAVYHAIAQEMTTSGQVTLVTVSPATPYVCAGYHQVPSREIDVSYCTRNGIPMGRRMTGGGAVYLDENQVFWHLILPQRFIQVDRLYGRFLAAPVAVYRRLGIAALHRPVNDIVVGTRKIGGTGAASIGDATVLVGSIMMDFDVAAMSRVLKVPSEKFRDKLVSGLSEYMTSIRREYGDKPMPTKGQVTEILVEEFARVVAEPVEASQLSEAEQERLEEMEEQLFDKEFVFRSEGILRPGVKISSAVQLYEGVHKAPGGLIRLIYREREGRFDDVLLAGDFFVYPENILDALSDNLLGQEVTEENFTREVMRLLEQGHILGVSLPDFVAVFQAAHAASVA